MGMYQMRIDELLLAIHEQEMSLLIDNLSDDEKEMTQVIIHDLKCELKELGFELKAHTSRKS